MKKLMLLPLAAMTTHMQASNPVFSNVVSQTTIPIVSAHKGRESLAIHANWSSTENAYGMIVARFAPSANTSAEETISLVLSANGSAQLLPPGASLPANILDNLEASAENAYAVSYRAYAAEHHTRVEGETQEMWDKTLDFNDFTPHTFTEVLILGHGLSLLDLHARFSPIFTLFLVK